MVIDTMVRLDETLKEELRMDTEELARSALGRRWIRVISAAMDSRFRHRFFSPEKILANSPLKEGQVVLEVGCGTGFFTIPAARLVGERGHLVAMDILPASVELVADKSRAAGMRNIQVIRGDALNTFLEDGRFDAIILYGMIPAPMLPLVPLLAEMHRILKPEGALTVWPSVSGWLPRSVVRSGLFARPERRKGVHNFVRLDRPRSCAGIVPRVGQREAAPGFPASGTEGPL